MLLENNIHRLSTIWVKCQLFCGGQNTNGPDNEGPNTEGPNTKDPNTKGPDTEGPNTEGPKTDGPNTEGPASEGLNTEGPSPSSGTIPLAALGPVVPMWNNYV